MARVRRGFKARRRRNRVRKLAKGFHYDRSTQYRWTAETVKRALHYSYVSRRLVKRDMRKLWIIRIGAAVRNLGSSYSKFMFALKNKNIEMNRKMLAEIAATDFESFKTLFAEVKN